MRISMYDDRTLIVRKALEKKMQRKQKCEGYLCFALASECSEEDLPSRKHEDVPFGAVRSPSRSGTNNTAPVLPTKFLAFSQEEAFPALASCFIVFNRKARTRKRRRELTAHGFMSLKQRVYAASIDHPDQSSWAKFWNTRPHKEEEWIAEIGIPLKAFNELVDATRQIYCREPLSLGNGRPRPCDLKRRLLDCRSSVAYLLYWISHAMDEKDAGNHFGLTDTEADRHLQFTFSIVLPALRSLDYARVEWPIDDEEYLRRQHQLFLLYTPEFEKWKEKPCFWVDGVRFPIVREYLNPKRWKKNKSGEKQMELRKAIFLFDIAANLVAAVWNAPGVWHESEGAKRGVLYDEIEKLPGDYCGLGDTAYRGGLIANSHKILRVLRAREHPPLNVSRKEVRERKKAITRGRQPSEWCNNGYEQFIERVCWKLGSDYTYNKKLIELGMLLYNVRVHFSSRNETKRFFENLVKARMDPQVAELVHLSTIPPNE